MSVHELTKLKFLLLQTDQPAYQVAASCGLHPSTLSRYALGLEEIKHTHLAQLCRFFGKPEDQITGWMTWVLEDEDV